MLFCLHCVIVAYASLTHRSSMALRCSWPRPSEIVGCPEVVCGSPTNSGHWTMDMKLPRRPFTNPALRWGWSILVWIKGIHPPQPLQPITFYLLSNSDEIILSISDLYMLHWPDSMQPGRSNRELRAEAWRALEELYEEG